MSVNEKTSTTPAAPPFTSPFAAAAAVAQALKARGLSADELAEMNVYCSDPGCKALDENGRPTGKGFFARPGETMTAFNGRKDKIWFVVNRILNPADAEASGEEVIRRAALCGLKHSNAFRWDVALVGLSQAERKDEVKRQAAIEAAGILTIQGSLVIDAMKELELPAEEQAAKEKERAAKAALQLVVNAVLERTTTCVLTGVEMTYGEAVAVKDHVAEALAKAGPEYAFVTDELRGVADALMKQVVKAKWVDGYPRFICPAAAEKIEAVLPKDRDTDEPRQFTVIRDGNGWRLTRKGEQGRRFDLFQRAAGLIFALENAKSEKAEEDSARSETFGKLGDLIPGLKKITAEDAKAAQPSRDDRRDRNDRGNGNRGNYRGGKGGGQRRGGGYTHPRRGEDGSRR